MTRIEEGDVLQISASLEWGSGHHHQSVTAAEIESLCMYVLEQEQQTGEWSVGVRIVDDIEISAMHAQYLNDASVTDIITFSYDDDDDDEAKGGDIAISADTASRNAGENGWSLTDELMFLIVHGLLHILGWDDASELERKVILDHQLVLLDGWRRR